MSFSDLPIVFRRPPVPPRGRVPYLAVTGGIACGKSLFGKLLEETGAEVADTDGMTHDLQRPGAPLAEAVRAEFGAEFLDAEGAVDRARLGALVFSDPASMARLNAAAHPLVFDALRAWLDRPTKAWAKVALIPLLFETRWRLPWDATFCVAASPAVQLQRLRGRGLSEEEARRRVASQMSLEDKIARADITVWNDGTVAVLASCAYAVKRRFLPFPDCGGMS